MRFEEEAVDDDTFRNQVQGRDSDRLAAHQRIDEDVGSRKDLAVTCSSWRNGTTRNCSFEPSALTRRGSS